MGKKGHHRGGGGGGKADQSALREALAAGAGGGGLSRPMPMPQKRRQELNRTVERLLALCSNLDGNAPATPQAALAEHDEIRSLVDAVLSAEGRGNMSRPIVGARRAHAAQLAEWLAGIGGSVDGVKVQEFPGEGLGLAVTSALSTGATVLRVPRRAMMSVDTARDSELGRLVEQDPMLQAMGNVSLSLHLMMEKTSPASFWEPYINSLPQTYTTVLYFTKEDMLLLRGSPALDDALKQYKYVARQYAYFYRKFQQTMLRDYFTYEDYRWAVSTVMTRQNQVPSKYEEGKSVNALIPFWDLANHRPGGQLSTDYEEEEVEQEGGEDDEKKKSSNNAGGFLKCMANRDFAAGEQFTIYYGRRGNHDLLVHNGFCLADNPDDFLTVRLGVGKNDALAKGKKGILETLALSPHGHFPLRRAGVPLDPLLLTFLRVLCLKSEEELQRWGDDAEKARCLLDAQPEGMEELDGRVYRYLLARCDLLLKSYPATLEQDREQDEEKLSATQRHCRYLVMGEKRILMDNMELCQERLKST